LASLHVKFRIGLYVILAIVSVALIGAAMLGEQIAGDCGTLAGVAVVGTLVFGLIRPTGPRDVRERCPCQHSHSSRRHVGQANI
jgi:hypothetical protein